MANSRGTTGNGQGNVNAGSSAGGGQRPGQFPPGWYFNTLSGQNEWWDGTDWVYGGQAQPQQPAANPGTQAQPQQPEAAAPSQAQPAHQASAPAQAPFQPQTPAAAPAYATAIPQAAAPASHKKSKKPLIITLAIVGAVLLLIGINFTVHLIGYNADRAAAYSSNLSPDDYVLRDPQHDLTATHTFRIPLDGNVQIIDSLNTESQADGDGPKVNAYDAVRVYADGSLTQEVPISIYHSTPSSGKSSLDVSPAISLNATNTKDLSNDDIFHNKTLEGADLGRWYGYGGYYLVRYIGEDGNKLDKPEVTYFTVENDVDSEENRLDAPANQQISVADNGCLDVSWEPVDGAQKYKVYLQAVTPSGSSEGNRYTYTLLAETTDTSINTFDYDSYTHKGIETGREFSDNLKDAGGMNLSQNYAFSDLVINDTEDEIYQNRKDTEHSGSLGLQVGDYIPNADNVRDASIAVVAVGDSADKQSPFEYQNINGLLGQMPIEEASYMMSDYLSQTPDSEGDQVGYFKHRLFTYVTMADGTTNILTNELDTSKMTSSDAEVLTGPDIDHLTRVKTTRYSVPYTVKGSLLSGNLTLYATTFPGGAGQITQQAREAVSAAYRDNPAAGMPTRADLNVGDVDWNAFEANQKPATEMANVPYAVSGSSDYVKFVASNLLAGNNYLDVTKYANEAGAPSPRDVVDEACWQNPLILSSNVTNVKTTEKDGKTYLAITEGMTGGGAPSDEDRQTLLDQRKAVDEEAQKILDEAGVNGSMSAEEKVRAIDNAISARVEYDYDYFNAKEGNGDAVQDKSKLLSNLFSIDAYSAGELLQDNKVICQGYAAIFQLCAQKAGLETVEVVGTVPPTPGRNNNRHAWNLVKIDGAWKVVDTTWDDAGDHSDGTYLLLDQNDPAVGSRTYERTSLVDSVADKTIDPKLIVG